MSGKACYQVVELYDVLEPALPRHVCAQRQGQSAWRVTWEGCSYILMLRGECGAAILVNFLPELLPAAWGESQPAYRQHGKSSIVLPTRTRFA